MQGSVYLVGGRAVGKSSIGVELARRLDCEFLDTDRLITEQKGASVAAIVTDEGWQEFRRCEQEVLAALKGRTGCVVATGGGAILHRELWSELKQEGLVVWLTADLDILCHRIRGDRLSETLRPSLTGKDTCAELAEVMAERGPLYRQTADMVIDTGKLTVAQAVQRIVEACNTLQGE